METAALERARETGCIVEVVCGDVSSAEDVGGVIERGMGEHGRLLGVVHGAVVLDDTRTGQDER